MSERGGRRGGSAYRAGGVGNNAFEREPVWNSTKAAVALAAV